MPLAVGFLYLGTNPLVEGPVEGAIVGASDTVPAWSHCLETVFTNTVVIDQLFAQRANYKISRRQIACAELVYHLLSLRLPLSRAVNRLET